MEAKNFAFLEAVVSLIEPDERPQWLSTKCGFTCYTCVEEDIFTVDPCANWFSLVLCDPGVVGFVKRVSGTVRLVLVL
jgi:hypothetical protein